MLKKDEFPGITVDAKVKIEYHNYVNLSSSAGNGILYKEVFQMKLLKCPKCGEMFSDTYKSCPFCAEDEELHSDRRTKGGGRRVGGGKKSPSALGPVLVVCLVLVVGLLGYTLFGDQIAALIGGTDENPGTPSVPVSLTLDKAELAMTTGQSARLTATGGEKITFTSGNEAVATVSEDGSVQAVAAGSTVVVASSGEQKATCRVTVTDAAQTGDNSQTTQPELSQPAVPANLTLQSIYGSADDISISVGESAPMEVLGTDSAVSWSVSDASVATVSSDGTVTGVAAGRVTLTATVDGQTLSCLFRVG